jgi:hypothetical protein
MVDAAPTDPVRLELYKLAVEMADRTSARRSTANSFYVSLQTAILAVLGVLTGREAPPSTPVLIAICAAGMATSITWFLQLRSYRDLNRAKFSVICTLEESLPVAIFGDEWNSLRKDPVKRWRGRYAELGTVERLVPWIFLLVNLLLAIYFGRL